MKRVHNSTIAIALFWTTIVMCYVVGFILLIH